MQPLDAALGFLPVLQGKFSLYIAAALTQLPESQHQVRERLVSTSRLTRNRTALSQEPYRWDSVAEASITAINARYQMLPYWLTLFAEAGQVGT